MRRRLPMWRRSRSTSRRPSWSSSATIRSSSRSWSIPTGRRRPFRRCPAVTTRSARWCRSTALSPIPVRGVCHPGWRAVRCGDATGVDDPSLSTRLDTSTIGGQIFVVSATDVAGNLTSQTYTYNVVDTVFPTVLITADSAGPYDLGEVVGVTCSFADPSPGSGLASVACGGVAGTDEHVVVDHARHVDGGRQDVHSARPTDAAGNTTTRTFTYEVVDHTCDPLGDVMNPDVDIVRCQSVVNPDGTATLSIIVDGDIALTGVQYRLRLADSPNDSGRLVKWVGGQAQRPTVAVGHRHRGSDRLRGRPGPCRRRRRRNAVLVRRGAGWCQRSAHVRASSTVLLTKGSTGSS